MFDDDDDRFEEDLLPDRDIDNDNLIDGLDLQEESNQNIFDNGVANSGGSGCLLLMAALPVAILLLLLT